MKLPTKLMAMLTIVLAGMMTTGCNDDDEGGSVIPENLSTDFATFASSNEQGSVFTLQKDGDSPLVTLTASTKIDTEKLKPGTRVIIQYVPTGGQAVYESGSIQLYGVMQVTNGKVEPAVKSEIDSWRSDRVKMYSMTRTGQYVNVWAEATLSREPQRFVIVADESTIGDEYPELYLVFTTDNELGRSYNLYGSFDLDEIWNLDTCKGVKINYADKSGNESKTFHKSGLLPVQPGVDDIVE